MIVMAFYKSHAYQYGVDNYYFKDKYLYLVQGDKVTRTYIHTDYLIFFSVFDKEGKVIFFSSEPPTIETGNIQELADLL